MSKAKKSAVEGSAATQSQRGLSSRAAKARSQGASGEEKVRHARSVPPPPKGIQGVPGSKNDSRRCSAKAHRTGERCKAPAILGGTVCRVHGGATPVVKKAAKERLLALLDPALAALHKILTDPNADDSVKVRAAIATLDRTGHGPGQTVTLQSSAWDETTDAMLTDMINANNGTLPMSRDMSPLPSGGGGERPTVNIQRDAEFDWIDGEVIEDDGVKPSSGASEFDPTPSGPYEPGIPTKEERLIRDLPPRNQRRQR